jgi:hypothetical protein
MDDPAAHIPSSARRRSAGGVAAVRPLCLASGATPTKAAAACALDGHLSSRQAAQQAQCGDRVSMPSARFAHVSVRSRAHLTSEALRARCRVPAQASRICLDPANQSCCWMPGRRFGAACRQPIDAQPTASESPAPPDRQVAQVMLALSRPVALPVVRRRAPVTGAAGEQPWQAQAVGLAAHGVFIPRASQGMRHAAWLHPQPSAAPAVDGL